MSLCHALLRELWHALELDEKVGVGEEAERNPVRGNVRPAPRSVGEGTSIFLSLQAPGSRRLG